MVVNTYKFQVFVLYMYIGGFILSFLAVYTVKALDTGGLFFVIFSCVYCKDSGYWRIFYVFFSCVYCENTEYWIIICVFQFCILWRHWILEDCFCVFQLCILWRHWILEALRLSFHLLNSYPSWRHCYSLPIPIHSGRNIRAGNSPPPPPSLSLSRTCSRSL